jgi:hypothetical protein
MDLLRQQHMSVGVPTIVAIMNGPGGWERVAARDATDGAQTLQQRTQSSLAPFG